MKGLLTIIFVVHPLCDSNMLVTCVFCPSYCPSYFWLNVFSPSYQPTSFSSRPTGRLCQLSNLLVCCGFSPSRWQIFPAVFCPPYRLVVSLLSTVDYVFFPIYWQIVLSLHCLQQIIFSVHFATRMYFLSILFEDFNFCPFLNQVLLSAHMVCIFLLLRL